MFEERFGRRPTTFLLALIGLGIIIWMIDIILDKAVWPTVTIVRTYLLTSDISWSSVGTTVVTTAILMVLLCLLYILVFIPISRFFMRRINHRIAEGHQEIVQASKELEEMIRVADSHFETAEQIIKEADKRQKEVSGMIGEFKGHLNEHVDHEHRNESQNNQAVSS